MDFETGNGAYTSACAIGLTYYEDDTAVDSESFLICPPESVGKFHWYNVKIHGITRSMVKDAPTFAQVWEKIKERIEGSILVCHNAAFDTEVLCRCLEFYHIPLPNCRYICTVQVAKKVWPELENHKLNTVAQALQIPLHHHQAVSDAHASGEILQRALEQTHCADAQMLAEKLQIRLGTISPESRRGAAASKQIAREQKRHKKMTQKHSNIIEREEK